MNYLTVGEIAERLRVSKMTVYRLIHSKDLPAIKIGHSFRVTEEALNTYLQKES